MERPNKQAKDDGETGAPEWMVTFSDCMTLLLTFFVLLLSFSSFDEQVFQRLKVIFSDALPSINQQVEKNKDAFLAAKQIQAVEELDEGSEKPTLTRGAEENLKQESEPVDFHRRKVFLIGSERLFWGKGVAISLEGRGILASMASFLKEVPGRIVISENARRGHKGSEQLGLTRAWQVVEYLTTRGDLDRRRFSISAASILNKESLAEDTEPTRGRPGSERTLEIVILERSIYN